MKGRFLIPLLLVGAVVTESAVHYVRAARVLTRLSAGGATAAEVTSRDLSLSVDGKPVPARLYAPAGAAPSTPALVLCHGIHRLGIEEPRLVRFAKAVAATGFIVLTPRIDALTDYRIDAASVPTIGAAAEALARETGRDRVGVMGFSFAGGLSLVAASQPATARGISFVVAIGAHDDLARVTRFFAEGSTPTPTGGTLTMRPHEYGPLVVAYGNAEVFFKAEDVPAAREAMRLRLWERAVDADAAAARLTEAGRTRFRQLLEGDRQALAPLLAQVTREREGAMMAASPRTQVASLRVPVFLLHGAGDSVIPPSETEWLAHDVPATQLRDALVSPLIQHVELHGEPNAFDKARIVRFLAGVLAQASAG